MRKSIVIKSILIATLAGCAAIPAGSGDISKEDGQDEHKEMSYQAVLDPVIAEIARDSKFGPAVQSAYQSVNEFARTDMAQYACVDSPSDWGLEVSFGGSLGVGYAQGLEFALHEGEIQMNCLNQVSLAPNAGASANVNLIRHVGECHSDNGGESLEDTLFLELGASGGASFGLTGQVGVAYTAGLSKGILNRTLPTTVRSAYSTYSEAVSALFRGEPVFTVEADEEHAAELCESVHTMEEELAGSMGGSAPTTDFLNHFLSSNSGCEDSAHEAHEGESHEEHGEHLAHAGETAEEHEGHDGETHEEHSDHEAEGETHEEHAEHAEVGETHEEHAEHEGDHHDEHAEDEHGHGEEAWSVCNTYSLKQVVGIARGHLTTLQEHSELGVVRFGLAHIGLLLELLDNLLSGCDHIEFQLKVGVGIGTGFEPSVGIESHNYYGRVGFQGTDAELGEAFASAIRGDAGEANACMTEHSAEVLEEFSSLEDYEVCEAAEVATSTSGILESLKNDGRFEYETVDSLRVYGFNVPLPENTLLNYTLACGLGPLRNTLETIWAP